MLTYDMNDRGGLARYDYLYRRIKEDILAGELRAGEKLPSKRALAQHLEVAVVTVENAYAQLVAEGYVCAREKRGYFVSQLEARPGLGADWEPPEEVQEAGSRSWLLDLEQGSGGTEGFPFSLWAKLMRRVLTERGEDLLRATPHSGAPELRRAIASQLYRFRGIKAAPEQIVVGAGTEYLYNLLVQLLGRGRIYGMEDPGYSKAVQIYGLNGASCVPLPVDSQGVTAQALDAQGVEILHISPNHQFPTGILTPHRPTAESPPLGRGGGGPLYHRGRLRQRVPLHGPPHPHPAKHRPQRPGHLCEHLFPDPGPLSAYQLYGPPPGAAGAVPGDPGLLLLYRPRPGAVHPG